MIDAVPVDTPPRRASMVYVPGHRVGGLLPLNSVRQCNERSEECSCVGRVGNGILFEVLVRLRRLTADLEHQTFEAGNLLGEGPEFSSMRILNPLAFDEGWQ
ncbi:hypothetical protein HQO84_00470 [Rhodococcus fascians]|nr:hypothetical protein [Rhodococcus fascians]MBY3999167.1 hypothetical protein [Rhodococcus fascians]MBY4000243.1 hypothetical protein [Rhodococcus fascians]MBY4005271.1 hypothetical protein [Rhodococcus fascians]MBY4025852.1 hypothetical protein [Rhodococcus fascians]